MKKRIIKELLKSPLSPTKLNKKLSISPQALRKHTIKLEEDYKIIRLKMDKKTKFLLKKEYKINGEGKEYLFPTLCTEQIFFLFKIFIRDFVNYSSLNDPNKLKQFTKYLGNLIKDLIYYEIIVNSKREKRIVEEMIEKEGKIRKFNLKINVKLIEKPNKFIYFFIKILSNMPLGISRNAIYYKSKCLGDAIKLYNFLWSISLNKNLDRISNRIELIERQTDKIHVAPKNL